ncbi:MAG: hypothetical protein NXH97_11385 [Rhodobacteraceae bacterium]|nr:hypothetical protein [Paracoccaceae bacterium]
MHDHLLYFEMRFFPKLCAFNLHGHDVPKREIGGRIGGNSVLLRAGVTLDGLAAVRAARYGDFPYFGTAAYR